MGGRLFMMLIRCFRVGVDRDGREGSRSVRIWISGGCYFLVVLIARLGI